MPTQATTARKRTSSKALSDSPAKTTGRATKKKVLTELDAVPVRESFQAGYRRFRCTDDIRDTYDKNYNSIPRDVKFERFAAGSLGVVSDCYILYAIAILGIADRETIFGFLQAIRKINKELSIPDITDNDTAMKRLANLVHSGFIFIHEYQINESKDEDENTKVKLFSITPDGLQLMNKKLGKRVIENKWFQAKPFSELVGWSCASFVSVCMANQTGFHEFNQGLYRTKDIGTVIMPPVVKTELNVKKEHPVYLCTIPAYLHYDGSYQTHNDYEDMCYHFVNTISQYFYVHDLKKHYCRMIVVVEDDNDLMEAASWINKAENMRVFYPRLFFTAEGAIRSTGRLAGNFLCMKANDSDPNDFEILPATPDFIRLS